MQNFQLKPITCLALSCCAITTATAQVSEKPNILFIISDQLSWQALPIFGSDTESLPTIDSLSRSGVTFSKSYTSCPLSMPARAALWTGQYPHTTGVESNGRNWPNKPVSKEITTIGEVFTEAGYECIHFGKQHDNGTLRGFTNDPLKAIKVKNEKDEYPLTRDSYIDVNTTKNAVKFLEEIQEGDKPFFCVVDLNNPHNICEYIGINQGKHTSIGDEKVLPELPGNFEDPYASERPHPVQYMCCSHVRLSQTAGWTADNYQHYLAAYYYYASRMDRDVEKVMNALEESGRKENTLIVFIADHGEGMAAKRMVTKQGTPYDQTTRVPLIITGKGVKKAKDVVEKPLVNVSLDLFPTLCDYAGIDTPEDLPGQSLIKWTKGKKGRDKRDYICTEWTTEWGFTVSPFRMIRSQDYKYVRYLEDSAEELFDMNNDPLELYNLATDPRYTSVLEKHRNYLAEHIESTGDTFYSRKVHWDERVAKHPVGYEHHTGEPAPKLPTKE